MIFTIPDLTLGQRSGKLYKPWGRKQPVLVRNVDHMLQLSDAPELSQRAVYADVSWCCHLIQAQAYMYADLRL